MNKAKACIIIMLKVFFCSASMLYSQQLAFPTAEGYGKYTVGGRGGKVIEVTNLNSSGAGSFTSAVAESGARTVVFRVSGTIDGNVSIRNDSITIAGQTAPGDGITLKGNLGIDASEVIIRYIRARAEANGDAMGGRYESNIILDHISASWSSDEVLSIYHGDHVTIQWSMITEACTDDHNFGGIWGSDSSTYHHNLIAHNKSRNPRWASGAKHNDYRNNVIYNWGYNSCYGGEKQQQGDDRFDFTTINMVANYYKPGPGTRSGVRDRIAEPSSRGTGDEGSWYVAGNFVVGDSAVTANNWLGVDGNDYIKLEEPWPAMPIKQHTPENAYHAVLDHAGCSSPSRDTIDSRIIEEVRNGTATKGDNGFVTTPAEAGGWPTLESAPAPQDSDHDGMPDSWETDNGLDPNDPEDRNGIGEGGYTNLEIYLNSLVSYPTYPTSVRESHGVGPAVFTLEQNYPNPFNPTTMITYQLTKSTWVQLVVYNAVGQRIATLVDTHQQAGRYSVAWEPEETIGAGIYFCRIQTGTGYAQTKKMTLLK